MSQFRVQEGKRAARPVGGWPRPTRGRVSNAFERFSSVCQAKFYIDPGNRGRPCAAEHPGAVELSCGKCQACLIVKRNMICGRMVAQSITSSAAIMLTLTYAPVDGVDPPGAEVITRADWVAFRKAMWNRHGQAQYCGAAELGELKRRVHWHIGLFFAEGAVSHSEAARLDAVEDAKRQELARSLGKRRPRKYHDANRPRLPEWLDLPGVVERDYLRAVRAGTIGEDGRFMSCGVECARQVSRKSGKAEFISWLPEWPHGYVHIREFGSQTAGYIAKYILKPSDAAVLRSPGSIHNSLATYVVRSQKLGYEYMRRVGEQASRQGLELRNRYKLPGQRFAHGPRAGKHREFTMTRGMKRVLCESYVRTTAEMLGRGELREWRCKVWSLNDDTAGEFPMNKFLDEDARRDPREALNKFFNGLNAGKVGLASLPYLDLGPINRAVVVPEGGVIVVTSRREYVFCWADYSGNGADIRIPIASWGELRKVLRLGGCEAFGLHDAQTRTRARTKGRAGNGLPGSRVSAVTGEALFPLRQVLEGGGKGIADPAARAAVRDAGVLALRHWEAGGRVGRRPKPQALRLRQVRAFATAAQLADVRRRIVALLVGRWSDPVERQAMRREISEKLGRPLRPPRRAQLVGIPTQLAGRSMSPEDVERFPAFAKWFREACPDAPPF